MPATINDTIVSTNLAAGVLGAGITSLDTVISLQLGQGANFPSPAADEFALLVIQEGGNWEVLKLTSRTGDVLTVERAQEGTLAQNFNLGAVIEQRITAGFISNVQTRIRTLEIEANASSFIGEVKMFTGLIADIPNIGGTGSNKWRICDGTNGTPDLRNKFVIGAGGTYAPLATGGLASWTGKVVTKALSGLRAVGHVLTWGQMPVHSHTGYTDGQGTHVHSIFATQYGEGGGTGRQFYTPFDNGLGAQTGGINPDGYHTHNIQTHNAGNNEGHDHALPDLSHDHDVTVPTLPPYVALAFIMRVA